jgi:deoxycytidylate deaminase
VIRLASKQAKKSTFERYRLGAVIVKGNRVLATGYNEIRYSKRLRKSNIHAEEAAILKLLKENRLQDLNGSAIYVSRVCPSGRTAMAKPCKTCAELIRSVGLDKVIYTTDSGTTEEYQV